MTDYYYSTQPYLAWVFNHYFFSGKHFAWVGRLFYPYKKVNPRTSSPLRVYEDLYEMWVDADPYNCLLPAKRAALVKGVDSNIDSQQYFSKWYILNYISNKINMAFFYPVVYRINLTWAKENVPNLLDNSQGSAAFGSDEFRIRDLIQVGYFDVLFLDFYEDATFGSVTQNPNTPKLEHKQIMIDLWENQLQLDESYVIHELLRFC